MGTRKKKGKNDENKRNMMMIDLTRAPTIPSIFGLIQKEGGIPDREMFGIFNMGVGLCIFLPEQEVDRCIKVFTGRGFDAVRTRERQTRGSGVRVP